MVSNQTFHDERRVFVLFLLFCAAPDESESAQRDESGNGTLIFKKEHSLLALG